MMALAILALLVFGPEGMPGVIKKVVRTIRALRTAAADFQTEVTNALEEENRRLNEQKPRGLRTAEALTAEETAPLHIEEPSSLAIDAQAAQEEVAEPAEGAESAGEISRAPEPEASSEEFKASPEEPVAEEPEDDDGPGLPMKRPLKSVEV